ncbi:MAG TPA: hypothetical protein VMB02_11515 [Candidatus Aquilonibacter sp.]|nr:hypothetical protein [Candidatus Aquilonibacter sp.]
MDPNQSTYPNYLRPEVRAELQKKETEAAQKAAREMKVAAAVIAGSFVLVLVLVALVIAIGHIQIF